MTAANSATNANSATGGANSAPGADAWHPSLWLRNLAAVTPGSWPLGRVIRAAVTVGGPILIGSLIGQVVSGMWLTLATMLLSAAETNHSYAERFRQIAIVAPVAAAAFLLGFLSGAPHWVVILVMAALAYAFGIVSGYSHMLSVATMQALLIAALAIGFHQAEPYWPAALLFLAGAALYALCLGIEAAIARRRPARQALQHLLTALADFAQHRVDGNLDIAADRRRVLVALDAYDQIALARRAQSQSHSATFQRAGTTSRAADQLFARLFAADNQSEPVQFAADRLRQLARAVGAGQTLSPLPNEPALPQLRMLEAAIADGQPSAEMPVGVRAASRWKKPIGRGLRLTALRLAVVTAVAYAVCLYSPIPHGYWVPLTAALVMKPDMGSVFARAVTRSVGTIVGAVAVLLIGLVTSDKVVLSIAIMVFAALLPWATARGYAVKAMVMTPTIMLMIDVVAPDQVLDDLTGARILATVAASVVVIIFGYFIWPSARHPDISDSFATALTALAQYARCAEVAVGAQAAASGQNMAGGQNVAGAKSMAGAQDTAGAPTTSEPGDATRVQAWQQLAAARRQAYQQLSNTHVAAQRLLAEPPPAGPEACAWLPVIATAERIADCVTDLTNRVHTPSLALKTAPADTAVLGELAGEVAALSQARAGRGHRERRPETITVADASADPLLHELADEIAALGGMLAAPASSAR